MTSLTVIVTTILVFWNVQILDGVRYASAAEKPGMNTVLDPLEELRSGRVTADALGKAAEDDDGSADTQSNLLTRAKRYMRTMETELVPLRFRFITPSPPVSATGVPSAASDPRACSESGQYVPIGHPPPVQVPAVVDPPQDQPEVTSVYDPICNVTDGTVKDCYHLCHADQLDSPARRTALGLLLQRAAGPLETQFQVRPRGNSIDLVEHGCGHLNTTGFFVGNIVVLVTVRPEYGAGGVRVEAEPCLSDPVTQRPEMIHVNIDPSVLDMPSAVTVLWIRRAFIHGIAMNLVIMSKFLVPGSVSTYFEYDNVSYPTGPIVGSDVQLINDGIVASVAKGSKIGMVGPKLLQFAKDYFACSTISHVELEDFAFGTDRLVYFEKRIFNGELMTLQTNFSITNASFEESYVFSHFTRAFMEDTGWYTAVATTTQPSELVWGKGEGCAFLEKKCGFGGYPAHYFCTDTKDEPSCGHDRRFTGTCTLKVLEADMDEAYRVFESTLRLGSTDVVADRCPLVAPAIPSLGGRGYCGNTKEDVSGVFPSQNTGWKRSESSRCFSTNATLISNEIAPATPAGASSSGSSSSGFHESNRLRVQYTSCHEVICVVHPLTKHAVAHSRIGDTFVPCTDGEIFTFVQPQSGMTRSAPNIVESVDIAGVFQCGTNLDKVCESPTVLKVPFWQTVETVSPTTAWKNGGVLISVSGRGLANCNGIRIGGVLSSDVNYNFQDETLVARMEYIPEHLGSTEENGGLGLTDVELRCVIPEVCPLGCYVSRAHKVFNLTALQPCTVTVERVACLRQPVCAWVENLCVEKILTDAPTPVPSATLPPDNSVDPGCFLSVPRYCKSTERCSQDRGRCLKCEKPLILCWNSECRRDARDCPCHPNTPFRCSNRACVSSPSLCPQVCDINSELGFQCWNRLCVRSSSVCTCPTFAAEQRCPNSGYCVMSTAECAKPVHEQCSLDLCPEQFRISIDATGDGSSNHTNTSKYACRAVPHNCPCSVDTPFKCWNGLCVATAVNCMCPHEQPNRCADGLCVAKKELCSSPMTEPPCTREQYRCSDLSCKSYDMQCQCSEKLYGLPELRLRVSDPQIVDVTRWMQVEAFALFSPCHIDFGGLLQYEWNVIEIESQRPVSVRTSLLKSSLLEVPPNSLTPNRSYKVTVQVTVAGGSGLQMSNASLTVITQVTVPSIRVLGGDKHIPAFSLLELFADIKDPEFLNGALRWSCCLVNPDDEKCVPNVKCDGVFAAVGNVRTPFLAIKAPFTGLPLGMFFFFVEYKGVSARTRVQVQTSTIPVCSIFLIGKAYSNRPVVLQAVIDYDLPTSFQWSMNGTILDSRTLRMTLPRSVGLPANSKTTVALTVTTTTDQLSQCHLGIYPLPAIKQGRCVVVNDDPDDVVDYRSNVATAGFSYVSLSAVAWEIASSDRLVFRMGYFDSTTERRILLSPDFSEVGSRRFISPVMLHNPSLITVRFFVEVTTESDLLSVLGESTCLIDFRSHQQLSTSALFQSSYFRMMESLRLKSHIKALDVASQLVTLLEDPDIPQSSRSSAAESFIIILRALVSNETDMALNPTRRSSALSLLRGTVNSLPNINISIVTDVQDIVHVLTSTRDGVLFHYSEDLKPWSEIVKWTMSQSVKGDHTFKLLREFAGIAASRVLSGDSLSFEHTIGPDSFLARGYHNLASQTVHSPTVPLGVPGQGTVRIPATTALQMLMSQKLSDAAAVGSSLSTPVNLVSSFDTLQVAVLVAVCPPPVSDTSVFIGGMLSLPVTGIPSMARHTEQPRGDGSGAGGGRARKMMTAESIAADSSYFRAPRVTPIVWFGVRVTPKDGSSGLSRSQALYEPLLFANNFWTAPDQYVEIVLRIDATDDFASGIPLWQRNFSCMVMQESATGDNANVWVDAGRPILSIQTSAQEQGAASVRTDPAAVCRVQYASGVIMIVDASLMTDLTPEPTGEPQDSKFSRISQLTSRLSTNAIVAIVMAPIALVTGIGLYAFFKRQKRLQAEEEDRNQERTQVLLLTELIRHDKDLQGALDVSRVRAKYEDVL